MQGHKVIKRQEPIIIKKSFIESNGSNKNNAIKKVGSILSGDNTSLENTSQDIKNEVKRILLEKGYSIEKIIDIYDQILVKGSIAEGRVGFRGGDVLKVLDKFEKFHGLEEEKKDDQETIKIRGMLQSKSTEEVTTFLFDITAKTKEYLEKIKPK